VLQRRRLAEEPRAERSGRRQAEADHPEPGSFRQLVGQDLRAEGSPRVAGSRGDHEPQRCESAADRGGGVRRRDEDAESRECEAERERSCVRVGSRRRRPRDPADTEDDPAAADQLPRPDPLVQDPRRQHEQQHDAEREHRLHERERREREREELQRPAADGEPDREEPELSPREPREQRDLHGSEELDTPRLERLQRVGDLEAH